VSKATPGEEWIVEQVDSKATASKVRDGVAKGNLYASYELIKYVIFAEGVGDLGDIRKLVSSSNDLLGLEREDFEEDVKKIMEGIKSSQGSDMLQIRLVLFSFSLLPSLPQAGYTVVVDFFSVDITKPMRLDSSQIWPKCQHVTYLIYNLSCK